ncbi:putative glycerol-3-phosphate o-acyltransferase 1 protein [Phaeoacremonium minimum UCRPA7]|uniref:Putative glycerol-3-phosphate o-acyltransferase 1 protein n=1 Tax=Phaeoacremonium minimum (strain UCR-PA7) TaxID=1286976 RepID=R8BKJ6_PHAM7|nr:putative glycerol-3-phosphate o-acyltransferase 1 protein [Phaeoacremonium minimum UCRPA7]EON99845.1 putative glycerol-3-phosphate o-acyltransferase 1 protein [Phaeoacremonium minimum UCRPA7]
MATANGVDKDAPPESASSPTPSRELYPMSNWKYDSVLWVMSIFADLFFREVHPRGSWKVPRHGPVLFVAAPHNNQFVDALVLQKTLRSEAKRRVSLLIAQKSVHGFIGWASRQVGAVPVGRAQDAAKPKAGLIYMPYPIDDPYLIRGVGTKFDKDAEVGGMIFLPSIKGHNGTSVDIAEVISATEIRVKRAFKGKVPMMQLTGRDDVDEDGNFTNKSQKGPKDGYEGSKYKLAPHIDQSKVYEAVFDRLRTGGCVGIFPEGGSHDRTGLLPLKAGVAIMALGALADSPDIGLKIVPVGMNYFHAHKFRSRAVVEFGQPIEVAPELVDMYKNGKRRDAIGQLLDTVYQALAAVTVSTPDYDTLMLIQAARRLYNPTGKKLPLPFVVELNRRLALGYEKYKDDQRIVHLSESVKDYNRQLRYLNIRDHQVQYAKLSFPKVILTFFYRVTKLLVLFVATLPGLALFSPVFVATKLISIRKAKEALAGSSVKIQGRDVMATWKILSSMVFAPLLYNFYICVFVWLVYTNRLWGYWDYVPQWFPLWTAFPIGWILFPAITFAALRFGEIGMDIFKSLRPLVMCINPSSSYNIQNLRVRRSELSHQVTEVINELGPEMFPDFEKTRLVSDPLRDDSGPASPTRESLRRRDSDMSSTGFDVESPPRGVTRRDTTASSRGIPKNESFSNIGKVNIFSTRPPSRSRSRSSSSGGLFGSSGFPISGFTTLDSKENLEEVSRKIREEMRERGEMRRRQSQGKKAFELQDEDESGDEDGAYVEARKKNA